MVLLKNRCSAVTCLVLYNLFAIVSLGQSFTKIGTNGASNQIQINNIGSDAFSPSKMSNWHYDIRFPLISPQSSGSCQNIYAANVVNNGKDTYNIYFGGWDGVSSCHDSVSIVVTEDSFESFNSHYSMIATGSDDHLNNPSAIKIDDDTWVMVYTELPYSPNLNKPGYSMGTNGIDWNPNAGGVSSNFIQINNYPYNFTNADINGGNVIYYNESDSTYHLFFIDFKQESSHSVFHATSNAKSGKLSSFDYNNIALAEPSRVVNDIKLINNHLIMGLHMNTQETFYSIGTDLNSQFSTSQTLFKHLNANDQYIVSIGFVVDETSTKLQGALYGAGAVSALDENRVFGIWLQKQVLFVSNDTTWGLGNASRAIGPDNVILDTNKPSLTGQFYLYDSDYVNADNRGTLLYVSDTVTVANGDIWQYND